MPGLLAPTLARVRLFVALRPPADAVTHLRSALEHVGSAPRPGAAGRWHVTLAFLGEVADPAPLTDPLAAVAGRHPPLALRLAGSGSFGAGPVWVGVQGDRAGLHALAADVAAACRSVGVALEQRPYRPHLTVGRRGRPAPAALAAYDGPVWTATEVELVRSTLGRTVDHDVLLALPLRGSPAAR